MTVDEVTLPPPSGDARRIGWLWIAAFVGLVVCTNVANASWAAIASSHPARLLMLSSRNRFLVAASPNLDFLTWAFIGTVRILIAAIVCHLIGREYGDRALRWFWRYLGMPQEQVGKFENAFARAEWFVVPFFVGSNIVWVLSGASRTTWRRLAPMAALGIVVRLGVLWWLSKTFESEVKATLRWTDRYQWWFLAGSIILVVLVNVRNLRNAR